MNEVMQFFNNSAPDNVATSVKLLLLLTVLSIAPGILIMVTSFTRIVIVLSFVRTALGTQQMPPNQVIIGLSLFLTFLLWHRHFNKLTVTLYNRYLMKN